MANQASTDQTAESMVERLAEQTGFPPDALKFLHAAYESAHYWPLPGEASPKIHRVTAAFYCRVLCTYAEWTYGPEARETFAKWGIATSEDVGRLVYRLVELGRIQSLPAASPNGFAGIYSPDKWPERLPWEAAPQRIQFDLGSLVAATTVVACLCGVGLLVGPALGWLMFGMSLFAGLFWLLIERRHIQNCAVYFFFAANDKRHARACFKLLRNGKVPAVIQARRTEEAVQKFFVAVPVEQVESACKLMREWQYQE